MGKKTIEIQNQTRTGTTTTTPNVPDYIQKPVTNYAGQVGGLLDDPTKYAPQITQGQRNVWEQGQGLKPVDFSQSNDILGGIKGVGDISVGDIQGESLLTGLDKYYNPFREQITNPVLSDYDEQSGITRAGQAAEAARNRAFQGSRYGIQEAQTEGQLARGRAATEGGLLKDMFTESTRLSGEDAARRQQASEANQRSQLAAAQANQQAQIANNNAEIARARELAANAAGLDESTRANLKLQADIADQEAAKINAQNQFPIELLNQVKGLLGGLDPFIGSTTAENIHTTGTGQKTNKQGFLDWAGDLATAYAGSRA